MRLGKIIYIITCTAVAVVSFHTGFRYAEASDISVSEIALERGEDSSRLTILTDIDPPVSVAFGKNKISIKLSGATISEKHKEITYSDELVESVKVSEEKETNETLIEIVFKKENVKLVRARPTAGNGVMFDLKSKEKRIRIAGITPEKLMTRPSGVQPKKDVVVAEQEPTESDESIEKRFAEIDTKYGEIQDWSGKEMYTDFLVFFQKEKYAEAIRAVNKFLKTYPDSIYREKALYTKAEALLYLAKKDPLFQQITLDSYNVAMTEYPNSPAYPRALMSRGSIYMDKEFHIEAMAEYGGLLNRFPKNKYVVTAMLNRAEMLIKRKKYKAAYNELEKILVLFPNKREVRNAKYLIGESFYDRKMYKEAGIIFSEAVASWPTYPKAHPDTFLKMADTKFELGNVGEAMRDWYAIANLFPGVKEGRLAMIRMGDTYSDLKKSDKAVQVFENIITNYPGKKEAILARLRLASLVAKDPDTINKSKLFDGIDYESPHRTFDSVYLEYEDEYGREALTRKGDAYAVRRQYVASIVAFKEVLRNYPRARLDDEIFNKIRGNFIELINTYHAQDGFFMALLTYYSNFDPFLRTITEPEITIKIADSYSAMGLHKRAIDYYKRVVYFDEKRRFDDRVTLGTGIALLGLKRAEKAEKMFESYIRSFPNSRDITKARFALGKALFEQGKLAIAITEWQIALEQDKNDRNGPMIAHKIGSAHMESGSYRKAYNAFSQVVGLYRAQGRKGDDPWFINDSYYKIAESYYLSQNYPNAIQSARRYVKLYPDDKNNPWMEYVISASLSKIQKDDLALKNLKTIVEKDGSEIIGRVASARIQNFEWKKKNPDLFID